MRLGLLVLVRPARRGRSEQQGRLDLRVARLGLPELLAQPDRPAVRLGPQVLPERAEPQVQLELVRLVQLA